MKSIWLHHYDEFCAICKIIMKNRYIKFARNDLLANFLHHNFHQAAIIIRGKYEAIIRIDSRKLSNEFQKVVKKQSINLAPTTTSTKSSAISCLLRNQNFCAHPNQN